MDLPPPNSHKATKVQQREPIAQVTSAVASKRRRPLGKQFRSTFIGGDAKTTMQYIFFEVLLPAAKDALVDAGSQGIERFIYGNTMRRRRGTPSSYGQLGRIAYNQMNKPQQSRTMSSVARRNHDFGEIVLESRVEATEVLDRMYDIIGKFDVVTVSELYSLVGLQGTHVDTKWGWDGLKGADVRRIRSGGYVLDLPEPEYLE